MLLVRNKEWVSCTYIIQESNAEHSVLRNKEKVRADESTVGK